MPRARVYGFFIVAVAVATMAASAAASVVHNVPKKDLRRRIPNFKVPKAEPPFVAKFDAEQRDFLNAHNWFRIGMKLPPLMWNATLTEAAHAWAVKRRRDCNERRHSKTPYGENIFVMNYREFSPRDVVQCWFNEKKLYDAGKQRCICWPERPGCECGHFLNVVWRTTQRLGCSSFYCDDQKGTYIVCEYDPPRVTSGINPFTGLRLL